MKRWTQKAIELRERFSKRVLLYSVIIFLISLVIYNATNNDMWTALGGLGMILFGSIFALFVISLFILWVLQRMEKNKPLSKVKPIKKVVKKSTPARKKVAKKQVKKAPAKKKSVKKVIKKKATKKKTTSKKRK